MNAGLPSDLEAICRELFDRDKVPGAAVTLVTGEIGYAYSYGVRSLATGAPVTSRTAFNIGSCSKAFTSAVVAALVADGLMNWDDPIHRYVPEFSLYDPWVAEHATLRDLSGNRLGLPREGLCEYGLHPEISVDYIFRNLKYTRPVRPFRDRFTYVNAGHSACAVACGRAAGRPFLDVLKSRLLAPLGMSGTSGGRAARSELTEHASWHVAVGDEIVEVDAVFSDQYFGSGGICTSAGDALRWLAFQLGCGRIDGRQIVAEEALRETHLPQSVARPGRDMISLFYPESPYGAYCLGWATSSFAGHTVVCHSGGDIGVSAFTLLVPEKQIGIGVYLNSSSRCSMSCAYALAARLLGLPDRDWDRYFETFMSPKDAGESAGAAEIVVLDAWSYAGTYRHPADGDFTVFTEGETLRAKLENAYKFDLVLTPCGEHEFRVDSPHPEVKSLFSTSARPVISFDVEAGRAVRVSLNIAASPRVFERR
jgi:CubicO group peptidase (beta-lactamase class C family)